jgi:hypothetical protein
MKKGIGVFIVCIALLVGCVNNSQNAHSYNEKIIEAVSEVVQDFEKVVINFNESDFEVAKLRSRECIETCDSAYHKLSKLGNFNGNDEFISAAKRAVAGYKHVLKNEYKDMIEKSIFISDEDNVSSYDAETTKKVMQYSEEVYQLTEKVNTKITKLEDEVKRVQLNFFKKHNIRYQ